MKRQTPRSRVIKRSETEPATRAGRWRKAMALAGSAVSSGANLCASERLCWALWLTLLMAGALARPYLPIDETRYVSVAWEMWHSGHWFVSSMNGAPYADKPVLLFWLIHAGWAVFGVNEVWPKVLMPLVSLLGIWQLDASLAPCGRWPRGRAMNGRCVSSGF
ncbi:ArnT family glycosyltransferase [Cobetia marina]